ncbi:MAG: urea transporter [Spirochaetales bacterium]|jgi:urea transporter|nr:urea transporter [Spirochaetales bacterium]
MPAYVTCRFPFVDKWKDAADKNPVLGFLDSLLSGYGQIGFNDNPVSGLLFIIGCFAGSLQHGVASLVCAGTATLAAYLMGVPRLSLRLGLYTFNAALAGLGLALFVFPEQGITATLILYEIMAGLLCVLLTAAFAGFLSRYQVPALALPYCTALMILIPASLLLTRLNASTAVIPYLAAPAGPAGGVWTAGAFFTAVMNNFAEILWQANVVSGVFVLLGLLAASRIDFLMAIIASVLASGAAILLGLPQESNMLGIYGYNGVLLVLVLFGRGYAMSLRNFFFSLILSLGTVIITAWLQALFAPLGVPVAAFPYVLVAILALVSREALTGLRWVDPMKWGVPETIAKALKKENKS